MMRRWAALCAAAAFWSAAALANDSTAELATGGLIFTRSDVIEMRSEDLFISLDEVRVQYRFFNKSDRDVSALVAFPMPDIEYSDPFGDIAVPKEDPENFLAFSTTADGKPVTAQIEQKAYAGGLDRTELLRGLGVPLAPHLKQTREALDKLAPDRRDELLRLGLVEVDEYDIGQGMEKHLAPRWRLKSTYYWDQVFPAGRELAVAHRYQPSVGESVQTSLGEPNAAKEPWFAEYRQKYCLEKDFLNAVQRARQAVKKDAGTPFSEARIAYVLTTGGNWAGPIGDFRLIVDKGAAANQVSFCGAGVKRLTPTQFEMRQKDFVPERNLDILILKPIPPQR